MWRHHQYGVINVNQWRIMAIMAKAKSINGNQWRSVNVAASAAA
jgi:hypothetical protein